MSRWCTFHIGQVVLPSVWVIISVTAWKEPLGPLSLYPGEPFPVGPGSFYSVSEYAEIYQQLTQLLADDNES